MQHRNLIKKQFLHNIQNHQSPTAFKNKHFLRDKTDYVNRTQKNLYRHISFFYKNNVKRLKKK
jgi:hypothetical protein